MVTGPLPLLPVYCCILSVQQIFLILLIDNAQILKVQGVHTVTGTPMQHNIDFKFIMFVAIVSEKVFLQLSLALRVNMGVCIQSETAT